MCASYEDDVGRRLPIKERSQLIRDLERGLSGKVPLDLLTNTKYYNARLLLIFAGASTGPESKCIGAALSKSARPLVANAIATQFEIFGDDYGKPTDKVRHSQDDTSCYLYLKMGFEDWPDSPIGLQGRSLLEWFETVWEDCYY